MKIENTTPLPTRVLRECVDDIYGMLITATKATYTIAGGELVLAREQLPLHLEPCEEAPMGEENAMREPGVVDMTVLGDIIAPGEHPAPSVDVRLTWGDEHRELRAFGPRVWQRTADGVLEPSEPELFTRIRMSWKHAYGGRHIIPAGFAPDTDLPMPSGVLAFSANPEGTGFYDTPDRAEGQPCPPWRIRPT